MGGMEHDLAAEAALLRVIAVEQVDAAGRVAARHGEVIDVLTAERLAGAEQPAQDDQPSEDEDPVTPGGEAAEPLEQVVQGPVPPRVTQPPGRVADAAGPWRGAAGQTGAGPRRRP